VTRHYYEGKLVEQDCNKSFKLFLDSAQSGNYNSQLYLGHSYLHSRGVHKNIKESAYWAIKFYKTEIKHKANKKK